MIYIWIDYVGNVGFFSPHPQCYTIYKNIIVVAQLLIILLDS